MIEQSLMRIKQQIKDACDVSHRAPVEITLVAVSKTQPVPVLKQAYALGVRDFGENKVQEIIEKYDQLPNDVRWHMIGHLQRNKVKYIIDKVVLIHSVDSIRLAETINKEAKKHNITMDILVEINLAKEASKFGIMPEETADFIGQIATFSNLRIKGFMTIAPIVQNPKENRLIFRALHKLLVDIYAKNVDNSNVGMLSMGMTNDFTVAIEEGATIVRIGTGIFGGRE